MGGGQVDDLDAGLEDHGGHFHVDQLGGRTVDGPHGGAFGRGLLVDGLAEDVEDAALGQVADGHRDGGAGVQDLHPAGEAVGRAHGDRADAVVAQVLLDLSHQADLDARVGGAFDAQGVVDGRQVIAEEDVDHGPDDLGHFAQIAFRCRSSHV
ncbi:hypothetical protein D3C87_1596290 [compost metagenome]